MNRRVLTLHHQTRLAVNIIIEDDTGVLVYSILLMTRLFTLFRQTTQVVAATQRECSLLVNDFKAAFNFTSKVFAIGFNSLAYGLGIIL